MTTQHDADTEQQAQAPVAAFLGSHLNGRTDEELSQEFHQLLDAVRTHGKKGQMTITIVIGLVPFEGSDGYRLTARLRHRIGQQGLRLGYKLERPDEIRKTAFADVVKAIGEQIDTAVMNGTSA